MNHKKRDGDTRRPVLLIAWVIFLFLGGEKRYPLRDTAFLRLKEMTGYSFQVRVKVLPLPGSLSTATAAPR